MFRLRSYAWVCAMAVLMAGRAARADSVMIDDFPKAAGTTVQRNPEWCWAASIEVVLKYYGVDRSQEEIVKQTYGEVVGMPAMSPKQLYDALNTYTKSADGGKEMVQTQVSEGAPPAAALVEQLKAKHPVLICVSPPESQSGHVGVIYGADYTNTDDGPIVTKVYYYDPWPDGQNLKTMRGRDMAPMIQYAFAVSGTHEGGANAVNGAPAAANGNDPVVVAAPAVNAPQAAQNEDDGPGVNAMQMPAPMVVNAPVNQMNQDSPVAAFMQVLATVAQQAQAADNANNNGPAAMQWQAQQAQQMAVYQQMVQMMASMQNPGAQAFPQANMQAFQMPQVQMPQAPQVQGPFPDPVNVDGPVPANAPAANLQAPVNVPQVAPNQTGKLQDDVDRDKQAVEALRAQLTVELKQLSDAQAAGDADTVADLNDEIAGIRLQMDNDRASMMAVMKQIRDNPAK